MNKIKFVTLELPTSEELRDGVTTTHYGKMTIAIDNISALCWDKTTRKRGNRTEEHETYSIQLKNGNEYTIDKSQHDFLSKVLLMAF